ncbi:hypothetical protein HYX13_03730 [Candidatus Woesearchaeota archaeon]|nr:hypothetical protein [Candidatus Woesearchaeota archaeon]
MKLPTQPIFPSVMAQNQEELSSLLKKLSGVAEILHLDIADGKAVPNTSLWFPFKLSKKFAYNAHLMIQKPEKWIEKYGKQVDLCIVQREEIDDPNEYIEFCKKKKKAVAFALKPETPIASLKPFLQDIDYVLVLTVHPGFYGAEYLPEQLQKVRELKKTNPKVKIIVDGGMTLETIGDTAKAGTDYFISGSFVSKSDEPKKAYKKLGEVLKSIS